jgi:hypothetical protein
MKKQMSRWLKWIVFYLFGILSFIVGQALVDLTIISSKWWLVASVTLLIYWILFLRKATTRVEGEIKYDWNKLK